jgi:UrcA family protein
MIKQTLSALGAAAMAAITLLAATPAAASPAPEDSLTISYAGLDMANPADAASFDRRVRNAAIDYCGQVPSLDLKLQGKVQACRTAILANAHADVALASTGGGTRGTILALRAR